MASPKRILIIEDEEALLSSLSRVFRDEGFTILEAETAEIGLALLAKKPDIILLDLILPGMSGQEFLKKIKKDAVYRDIPVVVLTNVNEVETVSDILKAGALDYCVKSDHTLDDIVHKVKIRMHFN